MSLSALDFDEETAVRWTPPDPKSYVRTRTALAVERWSEDLPFTREDARLRREYLRRRYLRHVRPRQPLQSFDELYAIPPGALVVAHLWRPAKRTDPAIQRVVAHGLRLAQPRRRRDHGVSGLIRSEHVGKVCGPFAWQSWMATASWQGATRCVFFDPGDAILNLVHRRSPMKLREHLTSRDEPALAVTPAGTDRSVRFESQPDGFGMVWPTNLDVVTALKHALAILPAPQADDEATIVGASGEPEVLPAAELLSRLEGSADVRLVDVDLGTAAIAWAGSDRDNTDHLAQMSFGDDYYNRDQVRSMLEETAAVPAQDVDGILSAAQFALRAHLPPTTQS